MQPPPRSAIAQLFEEPHRYGFMQAVRLIERWQVRHADATPHDVLGKRLRFRNSLSLAFPPSEIAEFRPIPHPADRSTGHPAGAPAAHACTTAQHDVRSDAARAAAGFARIEITPAFMGLLGAGGALPSFYTELFARRELLHRDHSARAFLDTFTHRAVALFYQAWRKHRLPLRFELDRRHEYLPRVLALAGLGQAALRDRLRATDGGVSDDALAHYAGLLRQRPVSAAAIRQLLADYFAVPVRLEPFIGRWFTLPREQQSALGLAQATLGAHAVVGERLWQRDLRLRLTIGPLKRAQFDRFLPGGAAQLALRELLSLLTGLSLEYDVRLTLRAADVRPARLDATQGPRLGWDGFLLGRAAANDRSDAGYDLHALA